MVDVAVEVKPAPQLAEEQLKEIDIGYFGAPVSQRREYSPGEEIGSGRDERGTVGRRVIIDITRTRRTTSYEEATLMERFTVNIISYFIIISLAALAVFLGYFIYIPIELA